MTAAPTDDELRERWRTPDGQRLAADVLGRLMANKPLADLPLGDNLGRIDVRGIAAPQPERIGTFQTSGWAVEQSGGTLTLKNAEIRNMDFSGAQLHSVRFYQSTIADCRFDDASCRDWRLWAVDVMDSTFIGADLRDSVLGAWHEGRGDVYRRVNFDRANLRSIVCPEATFVDCDFGSAQIANVEFGSTGFVRCRFAGLLSRVIFSDRGFRAAKADPNLMEDVDFSEAELRMVEFRNLDLDHVRFPNSEHGLIVSKYRCVLERAVRELAADDRHNALRAVLELDLKASGPHQEIGYFDRRDFVQMFQEAGAEFATALLRRLELECDTKRNAQS